jgi:hypothetical protein
LLLVGVIGLLEGWRKDYIVREVDFVVEGSKGGLLLVEATGWSEVWREGYIGMAEEIVMEV